MAAAFGFTARVFTDLDRYADVRAAAMARGLTTGMRQTVFGEKRAGRRELTRRGLGKLANAWRGVVDPKRGDSLLPRGVTYSKATTKNRPGGFVDIITVHRQGALIRAQGGRYLWVPARGQPRGMTPTRYGWGRLRIVYLRAGRGRPRASGRTAGYAFDRSSGALVFVIRDAVRVKGRVRFDAMFRRSDRALQRNQDRAVDRELDKAVRRGQLPLAAAVPVVF